MGDFKSLTVLGLNASTKSHTLSNTNVKVLVTKTGLTIKMCEIVYPPHLEELPQLQKKKKIAD